MKYLKKTFVLLISLAATLSLSSCSKTYFNSKLNTQVASQSTTESVASEYGDKLVSLEGDVFTLSKYTLPKVGDRLHGFTVDAIYDFEMRNAKLVIFHMSSQVLKFSSYQMTMKTDA